uniref:C2H2-type domain-containing protein n=1 Tax=Timema cristinae TaxID=61476 RepID=A0A7R9CQN2_TIMCR|nr:unnamed protein product [Timema cristinae]
MLRVCGISVRQRSGNDTDLVFEELSGKLSTPQEDLCTSTAPFLVDQYKWVRVASSPFLNCKTWVSIPPFIKICLLVELFCYDFVEYCFLYSCGWLVHAVPRYVGETPKCPVVVPKSIPVKCHKGWLISQLSCCQKCPELDCQRHMSSDYNLRKHYNNVHSKLFSCTYCNNTFSKRRQLSAHIFTHTGVPPFRCDRCDIGCASEYELKRHQRGHKTHTCTVTGCNLTFDLWTQLRKHAKLEHPLQFACLKCNKVFKTKHNLKLHIEIHEDPDKREVLTCPYDNCSRPNMGIKRKEGEVVKVEKVLPRKSTRAAVLVARDIEPTTVWSFVNIECSRVQTSVKTATPSLPLNLQNSLLKHGVCIREHPLKITQKLQDHMKLHNPYGPLPRRRNQQTKERKKRIDAGKHKHSAAVKLSGIVVPYEVEKQFLHGEDVNITVMSDAIKVSSLEKQEVPDSLSSLQKSDNLLKKRKYPFETDSLVCKRRLVNSEKVPYEKTHANLSSEKDKTHEESDGNAKIGEELDGYIEINESERDIDTRQESDMNAKITKDLESDIEIIQSEINTDLHQGSDMHAKIVKESQQAIEIKESERCIDLVKEAREYREIDESEKDFNTYHESDANSEMSEKSEEDNDTNESERDNDAHEESDEYIDVVGVEEEMVIKVNNTDKEYKAEEDSDEDSEIDIESKENSEINIDSEDDSELEEDSEENEIAEEYITFNGIEKTECNIKSGNSPKYNLIGDKMIESNKEHKMEIDVDLSDLNVEEIEGKEIIGEPQNKHMINIDAALLTGDIEVNEGLNENIEICEELEDVNEIKVESNENVEICEKDFEINEESDEYIDVGIEDEVNIIVEATEKDNKLEEESDDITEEEGSDYDAIEEDDDIIEEEYGKHRTDEDKPGKMMEDGIQSTNVKKMEDISPTNLKNFIATMLRVMDNLFPLINERISENYEMETDENRTEETVKEVVLRISLSPKFRYNETYCRTGDWVISIGFLQEADITSLANDRDGMPEEIKSHIISADENKTSIQVKTASLSCDNVPLKDYTPVLACNETILESLVNLKLLSSRKETEDENINVEVFCGDSDDEDVWKCCDCGNHFVTHKKEKPFKCLTCGVSFMLNASLIRHSTIHNGQSYKCTDCGKLVRSKSALKRHIETHMPEKVFKCALCDLQFRTKENLLRHNSIHTNYRPFECADCGRRKTHLKKHSMLHDVERPCKCVDCGLSFNRQSLLRRHITMYHSDGHFLTEQTLMNLLKLTIILFLKEEANYNKLSISLVDLQTSVGSCVKQRLILRLKNKSDLNEVCKYYPVSKHTNCNLANKIQDISDQASYTVKEGIHRTQMQINSSSSELMSDNWVTKEVEGKHTNPCIVATKKLKAKGFPNKKKHANEKCENIQCSASSSILKCPTCCKVFKYKASLKKHVSMHSFNEFQDECEKDQNIVFKDFVVNNSIDRGSSGRKSMPMKSRHTLGVITLNEHKCLICGRCFKAKNVLQYHIQTHTEGRIYMCNECGKSFNVKSIWQSHIQTHTGGRIYTCNECGKIFNAKKVLEIHFQTHTGDRPYKCDKCEKTFGFKSHLKRHMLIHNRQKPYKCAECGYQFRVKWNLKVHMANHIGQKEKVWNCPECDESFESFTCLTSHKALNKVKEPHKCVKCGHFFKSIEALLDHQSHVHVLRSFHCSICDKSFKIKYHLNRHLLLHSKKKLLS